MAYKNYNVLSPEIRQMVGKNLTKDAEAILKKVHYTKKVDVETVRKVLKAGATPNKFLFDAIVKYYEGKKVSI